MQFFGCVSSGPLFSIDVGCEEGGREGSGVVCSWREFGGGMEGVEIDGEKVVWRESGVSE